jgi:hypothetical protein
MHSATKCMYRGPPACEFRHRLGAATIQIILSSSLLFVPLYLPMISFYRARVGAAVPAGR